MITTSSIDFDKLKAHIRHYGKRKSLDPQMRPRFTKLLVLRGEMRVSRAKERLEAAVKTFKAVETSGQIDSSEDNQKFFDKMRQRTLDMLGANVRKAQQRRHLTEQIKVQTAFELNLIDGDTLNRFQVEGISTYALSHVDREFISESVIADYIAADEPSTSVVMV